MQLTMTGEYAIRTMLHLASANWEEVVEITEISEHWQIPENFLRKIVTKLSKAGLIETHRGTGGGIRLAKDAAGITLWDVIEAAEGEWFLNRCLIGPNFCSNSAWCEVHLVWQEAQAKLKEILGRHSLADLAKKNIERQNALAQL